MSIKVLESESVEYNIYAVKSTLDEEIELNDDCRKASGFKDKFLAIGYAICLAENFDYTDVFVTENKTINNYFFFNIISKCFNKNLSFNNYSYPVTFSSFIKNYLFFIKSFIFYMFFNFLFS